MNAPYRHLWKLWSLTLLLGPLFLALCAWDVGLLRTYPLFLLFSVGFSIPSLVVCALLVHVGLLMRFPWALLRMLVALTATCCLAVTLFLLGGTLLPATIAGYTLAVWASSVILGRRERKHTQARPRSIGAKTM
ncbi:MAG TPA: hypothetical protein VGE21_14495 [Flavobacteriales bacterium]